MADKYKVKVSWPKPLGSETYGPMDKDSAEFLRDEMEALGATVTMLKVVK